jgi:hypothetical protein
MVSTYDVKNPPKRKIPKNRVSRQHHYVMKFPTDLLDEPTMIKCYGLAYINFFDSFLDDCVKRMSKSKFAQQLYHQGEFDIMTACLN